MTKRKPSPRKTHKFQLRQDHAEDMHVQEIIEFWKSKKKGITNIRKAIALFYALENGDDTLLTQLFPSRAVAQPMFPDAAGIVEALQRLTTVMERGQVEQPKKMDVPQLPMPIFEDTDDEPTVLVRTSTSQESCGNFVSAMTKMQ